MRIIYFLLLSSLLYGSSLSAQQTINATLQHDGLEREYILYVPASYDPATPMPLVLCFHGYGSNATLNMNYTNFTSIADTAGFILVHPQGTLLNGITHWNVGGWTIGSTVDDVGFTDALLDTLSNAYTINQDRIYSTGMSNGGYMSFLLACQLSDRFAAVASVTGSMTVQTSANCSPVHPTPVLQIHGTADDVVPYAGDPFWTTGIEAVLQYWTNYNNCAPTPSVTAIPDLDPNDGSTVEHIVYPNGDHGVTTEHFKVYGGGHDWPGAFGNMDIDASVEVWRFFARFDRDGAIDDGTVATEFASAVREIRVYPNPAPSTVQILSENLIGRTYQLLSMTGVPVQSGIITSDQQELDMSSLVTGTYLLRIGNHITRIVKTH